MAGESVAVGLDIGVVDIDVHPGAHICGMYRGAAERDDLLVAFLNAGLAAGDKCICVIDAGEPSEIIAALSAELAARERADDKQLDVIRASDMHLRSGRFSADETIGSWKAAVSEVMYDGRFDLIRAVETWSLRDVVPDARELVALDSEINRFLPLIPRCWSDRWCSRTRTTSGPTSSSRLPKAGRRRPTATDSKSGQPMLPRD